MSGKTYYLFQNWDRFFLPAFATVVFCPELTSIEKFPCFISDNNYRDCLLVSCCSWWSLMVPAEHQELLTGPMKPVQQATGKAGCTVEGEPCTLQTHPLLLCGVVPGDNRPLQGWNSETCKEESPHREGKSHTVCPSSRGGITATQVLSLLVTLAQTVQHLWEPARPKDQLKHANLLHVTAVWQTFLQFNYKLQCRSRKRKNKLQTI